MTPEEAREIDRLEFEASCRAARDRAFAVIAERHGAERAEVLRWVEREAPRMPFIPAMTKKPAKPLPPVATPKAKRAPFGQRYFYEGRSMTQSEWAEHLGITLNSFHQRVHRLGSVIDAIAVGGHQSPGRPRTQPGVVKNFPTFRGTGGGPTTQDIPQIEFSQ